MIANRLCAFALVTAFAIFWSAPSAIAATPAIAATFDGSWNMFAVTTNGHCGIIKIGMGIDRGRIFSTGGRFVFHRIQLTGRVTGSGQALITAVAGPRIAKGTGRFNRSRATGTVVRYRSLRCLHRRVERRSRLTHSLCCNDLAPLSGSRLEVQSGPCPAESVPPR